MARENDGEIRRVPMPEDSVERFLVIVLSMVEPFGIDSPETRDIYHCVELLRESVEKHLFEKEHPLPTKRKDYHRKRFIAIFKGRYQVLSDLDYSRRVTPVDTKLIDQVNRALKDAGFTCEEYLKWLFEDFLVDNPKFCPPTIRQSCGDFFVQKFLYERRDQMKEKREDDIRKKEAFDLVARGRKLLAGRLPGEDDKRVRDALKAYSEGRIILSDLKEVIEALEATVGKEKRQ